MHSALTGVRVTRTPEHAHWLAHFCWGLHIVTEEKGKAAEISYSDVRSLVHFCRGFILWQQGTCFYVWLWYKRERTPKHSVIWLILGGYAPSYKSDNLVFRCSFYYLEISATYLCCCCEGLSFILKIVSCKTLLSYRLSQRFCRFSPL
jgi:hypothetical protein